MNLKWESYNIRLELKGSNWKTWKAGAVEDEACDHVRSTLIRSPAWSFEEGNEVILVATSICKVGTTTTPNTEVLVVPIINLSIIKGNNNYKNFKRNKS